jgi:glycosyltransferase involved in cell wall biosynthesis
MNAKKRIFWVDADRFDRKGDKSTWLEMAGALKEEHGFEPHIVTGFGRERYQPENANVIMDYRTALDFPFIFRVTLLLNILLFLIREARRGDIVIVHPEALWIAPILRIAGIRNIHLDIRTVPVEINSLKKRIDRLLFWSIPMRLFAGSARGHSFITERLKVMVEAEFRSTFNNYIIWQSGVNTDRFSPGRASVASGADSRFVIFYHGSISENRGISSLVRALALVHEKYRDRIGLVLLGSGSAVRTLTRLTAELGITDLVSFKDPVPYEEVAGEIAQADFCICPLPDRPEWNVSSPLKVLEYMACGRPIIVTPIGAHKDVLDGTNFVVWTAGDKPVHFRDAIEYAYEHREMLKRAAGEAPAFVRQRYDWAIHARVLGNYLATKLADRGVSQIHTGYNDE